MTYYTMKDLTERYSVHRNTIWRWIKTRGFPAGVAFSPTTRRFPVSEVEAWDEAVQSCRSVAPTLSHS